MSKRKMIFTGLPNPNEMEALGLYQQAATKLIEDAGGVVIEKLQIGETIIGNETRKIGVVVEFPSIEAIKGVFDSEEYIALIPLRDKGFIALEAYVSEN